ncbi:MAG: hypothetical protein ACI92E_001169 [Oceanicoccus sp.]|jgi:hypothetical protein
MLFTVITGLTVAVALAVLLLAGKLLVNSRWFLGWLRGMLGLCLILGAIGISFGAADIYTYRQLSKEQVVASIGFHIIGPQQYRVSLVDHEGKEQIHELNGDLWQLDARVLRWGKSLSTIGFATGYRLDRLSGRFYSLEKEKSSKRTVYELGGGNTSFDVWRLLKDYVQSTSIVNASYGSATYLPMTDGALYSVSLSNTGLLARPLNGAAKTAVAEWD